MVLAEPVLVLDSIARRFGDLRVLSAATLHAPAGSITALLGRNGSGKSTLLRIAAGLLAPDHGIIRFRGRTHTRTRLADLARHGLYYLPAHRPGLAETCTLGAHVDAVERRDGSGDCDRTGEVLRLLEVSHLLDRRPHTFSGGERRRAEIAMALLRRPACLLADEPFLGVTPRDIQVLSGAFRHLAQTGCAVVVTGHELAFLFEAADRVTWIVAGTTYLLGTPDEAQRSWRFRQEYLGPGAPVGADKRLFGAYPVHVSGRAPSSLGDAPHRRRRRRRRCGADSLRRTRLAIAVASCWSLHPRSRESSCLLPAGARG